MKILKRYDGINNDLVDEVKILQSNLNRKGYALSLDGKFGLITENALKDYQTKNGLQPTGIADSITINKLIGVKMDTKHESDYQEFLKYKAVIVPVLPKYKYVTLDMVFGLGSRESNWGLSLVNNWGDNGFAFGIFQIDKRWNSSFINSPDSKDFTKYTIYSLNILENNIKYFISKHPSDSEDVNVLRGICAYNAGCGGVDNMLKKGSDPNLATTGHDYGTDVISRAIWFNQRIA